MFYIEKDQYIHSTAQNAQKTASHAPSVSDFKKVWCFVSFGVQTNLNYRFAISLYYITCILHLYLYFKVPSIIQIPCLLYNRHTFKSSPKSIASHIKKSMKINLPW